MLLIFIAVRNAWRRRIWRFVILRRTLRIWYYSAWPTSSMYCLEVKVTPGYKVKSFTVDLHEVCPEAKCLYFNFLQCSCTDFLWLTAFHKSGFLHETTHQPLAMIISMTHARKGIAWIAEESKHEHKIVANKFSVASCPFVAQHQTILFRFFLSSIPRPPYLLWSQHLRWQFSFMFEHSKQLRWILWYVFLHCYHFNS